MNPTVRKLLENIAKLSEELQKPTSGSQAVQEREVSQAFGRSSSQSTSSPSSQTSNAAASSSLAQGSTLLASSSQTQRFRLGYNFMRNKGGSKSRQKHKVQAKKVFLKDVVLLGGPKDSVVPRQGTKVLLMENKHIVSSVEFDKNWDHSTVVDKVKGLFPDKLGEFDEVELLMPVHHKLMVPQLSPGQTLSAQLIQKVFKDKPIYVRPPKELLEIYEEPPSKKKYEEIEIHSSGDEKNDDKKSDDEFKYSAFQGVLNNYCIPLAIVTPHNCNAYKFPSAAHVENENIYYTSTLAVAIGVFLINLPIYISIHLSIYQFIKTNCKVMFLSSDQAESARPISESIAASDQATLHNDETADKNDQSELPSNQHTNHYHHDSETPTPLPTDVSFYDAIIEEINKKELTDPVEILRLLQTHLVKGRDLDVVDVSNSSEGATNYICVDRENILKTTFSELESIENFLLTFEVDFMGELAKDFGGPRKEWIRLVNAAMKDKYFDKGLREYLSDEYYYVGIMLGVALLQNGQLPTIIPEDMINQLIYPSINKCIVNLQKGLNKFGLVRIFQRKPVLLYLLKPRSETLNAKMLIKLLSPVFAPDGSTAHSKEKEVYAIFVKYIRQVASGRRAPVMLTSILAFVTGAEEEPVLGFAKHPSITFAHGWTNDLASEKSVCYIPTAHTCTNNLVLPRGPLLKVLPSEEKLFELYDLAFANNHFGVM